MKNGQRNRFQIAKGTYLTPKQLESGLYSGVIKKITKDFENQRQYEKIGSDIGASSSANSKVDEPTVLTTDIDKDSTLHPPENKRSKKDVEIEFNAIIHISSNNKFYL